MIVLGAKMRVVNGRISALEEEIYGPPQSLAIAKAFEDNPHETSDPLPEYDKKPDEPPKVLTEAEELAMKHRLERQKTLKEQVRETNNALLKQQTRINEKRTQMKKARKDRMFLPNVSQVK